MANPLHYPDITRCKKLTEIGFPEAQYAWCDMTIRENTPSGIIEICESPNSHRRKKWTVAQCPSVMEMLDVIPKFHEDLGWLVIKPMASGWSVGYDEHNAEILGELPNALADLIFWLHENNYIKF